MVYTNDSSPFGSSPLNNAASPRLFWQGRDPKSPSRFSAENENLYERVHSPSPKRSSIENLKRASRVKNSNMFAKEHVGQYDPASSVFLDRPLAAGRPLNAQSQTQNTSYDSFRKSFSRDTRMEAPNKRPNLASPMKSPLKTASTFSPHGMSKNQLSPSKSSLSKANRFKDTGFDPENGIWSEDDEIGSAQLPEGRYLHRHAKSVTFDAAPPQVNEYEQATPDPSSVASGSREGSYDYDSADDDYDSFERGSSFERDDSFDASLEDTDKTPVVLPEDWRFMSPEAVNTQLAANFEDPFEEDYGSPEPTAQPKSLNDKQYPTARVESTESSGSSSRPLPPLPPPGLAGVARARSERSDSNNSLMAAAERASNAQRNLPSPPRPASISKADILGINANSMSLEDRLELMKIQDEDRNAEAKHQKDIFARQTESEDREFRSEAEDDVGQMHADNAAHLDENAFANDYQLPPRISRESILRKIQSQTFDDIDDPYEYSSQPDSSPAHAAVLDPDIPIASVEETTKITVTEEIEKTVVIKQEEDDEVDMCAIPSAYEDHHPSQSEQADNATVISSTSPGHEEDDDASHYSCDVSGENQSPLPYPSSMEEEGQLTPRAQSPQKAEKAQQAQHMALPEFAGFMNDNDFDLSLSSYMSQSMDLSDHKSQAPPSGIATSTRDWLQRSSDQLEVKHQDHEAREYVSPQVDLLHRPQTPENKTPEVDNVDDLDSNSGTPDSVIRHPRTDESSTPESLLAPEPSVVPETSVVPERAATIKAPGGKLKTRPSLTPADTDLMAETRRRVSGQSLPDVPSVPEDAPKPLSAVLPPVPQRKPNRVSTNLLAEEERPSSSESGKTARSSGSSTESVESKRVSSLVKLDIPVAGSDESLGWGLDKEFDRVIESQKVAFAPPFSQSHSRHALPGAGAGAGNGPYLHNPHFGQIADRGVARQRGYLMRQNTKVVVASSRHNEDPPSLPPPSEESQSQDLRGTKSAGNSPRKPSQTKTWTTEPWNGKARRKSIRTASGSPQKKPVSGPAPPLPGQQSVLGNVAEDQAEPTEEFGEDGSERGRLFVKVVGVKNLDLPLPRGKYDVPVRNFAR